LWVEDGVIQAVEPWDRLQAQLGSTMPDEVIDLRPHWVLPGLIDGHVHLFSGIEPRSLWLTQYEGEPRLALRAGANARAALATGVTTLRDCGARGDAVRSLVQAIDEGMLVGPRIVHCGSPITSTSGHCWYFGIEVEGVTALKRTVRELHKAGIDFCKVMVTGGGQTPGTNRCRAQYTAAELGALADDAHRLGHRVVGHAHGTEGIRRAVQAGFDSIEHCSWLAAEENLGLDYDPALADEIARRGIYVCQTRAEQERLPVEKASPEHPLWEAYEMLRRMARVGIKLVAGDDAGIPGTPFTRFAHTLESMAALGEMPHADVLASATSVAAESLGIADEVGTLRPGKKADLIAVAGSPLLDLRVLRRPLFVLQDGRVVAREGQVLDEPAYPAWA
jgi:imidazolonepropionase-like amidohydrolase